MMTEEERQPSESLDSIAQEENAGDLLPDADGDEAGLTSPASDPKKRSYPDGDVTRQSFWGMVRRFFFMTRRERLAEREWRLEQLTAAIVHDPDASVNYLLRGEIHLKQKRYERAYLDLRRAVKLAEEALKAVSWGIAEQSIRDKALHLIARIPVGARLASPDDDMSGDDA